MGAGERLSARGRDSKRASETEGGWERTPEDVERSEKVSGNEGGREGEERI